MYLWCLLSVLLGAAAATFQFHPCCPQVLDLAFLSWQYDASTEGGRAMALGEMGVTILVYKLMAKHHIFRQSSF